MTGCEGQDWASYQSNTPSTAGLTFAAIKATEGTDYVNSRHAAQVAHARAEGLVVAHYHFARPGSMAAQVTYFLAHAGAQAGEVLALDWEDTGVTGADKDTFLKALQEAAPGHRVILYCNKSFWKTLDKTAFAADGLWIADPTAAKGKPGVTAPWLIHQYSEAGGLDRDYCNLTAAQLRAWAADQENPAVTHDPLNAADDKSVWAIDNLIPAPKGLAAQPDAKTNPFYTPATHMQLQTQNAIEANLRIQALAAEVDALKSQVAALTDPAGFVAQVAAQLSTLEITVTPKES